MPGRRQPQRIAAAAMAPLAGAAKAAVEDFFSGRRGTRSLHPELDPERVPDVRASRWPRTYLLRRQRAHSPCLRLVRFQPLGPPLLTDAVLEWRAEWRDYAKSAGLADDADVNNIAAGGSPRTPLLSLTSID